jgi:hypothetical protein
VEIADVIRTPRLLMRWPRREAPLGLFAHLHPDTAASIRVLEKCGLARQDVGQTCIRRFVLLGTVALACLLVVGVLSGCSGESATSSLPQSTPTPTEVPGRAMFEHGSSEAAKRLAAAAESQVGLTRSYDPAYIKLDYPGGDVPKDRGVCTDVVVRAFRELGVDLQVEVHEDMSAHFEEYPRTWGLKRPDSNIDHRRVPNLQTYFKRKGDRVRHTSNPEDYWPGDIVTWDVAGRPHIGIVSTVPSPSGERYCIVHNIGAGTRIEDRLFDFEITGHYRPL